MLKKLLLSISSNNSLKNFTKLLIISPPKNYSYNILLKTFFLGLNYKKYINSSEHLHAFDVKICATTSNIFTFDIEGINHTFSSFHLAKVMAVAFYS